MHIRSVALRADQATLCAVRRPLFVALGAAFIVAASLGGTSAAPEARAQTPPESTVATVDIIAAKTAAANLYDGYLRGTARYAEYQAAQQALTILTGEEVKGPVFGGKRRLEEHYSPFRQVTDYYCGPAAVQSILWFLGVRDEGAVNQPALAKGMTGRADVDQRLLAGEMHLRTEQGGGTDWGTVVPDTINQWRGTRWYAAFGTPTVGGSLDQDQAWRYIQYAVDHGYPVAANVLLSPNTVIPTGFDPGSTYQHWETIAGYFIKDGVKYVKVGQVYGTESLGYDPLQEIPWDTYWPAIGNHYGIVW